MNFRPKYQIIRSITVFIFLLAFLAANIDSYAKDATKSSNKKEINKTENIVRTGTINLKKIDKNKDGKVFQCPMDWNVISDKSGKCPVCKMDLAEVTLQKAKDNLIKHGFKVK